MTGARAWLEIDRIGGDHTSDVRVWERVPLDQEQPLMLSALDAHITLAAQRVPASRHVFDVLYARNRWMLQPRVHDVYRNAVHLQRDERYPLDNGDRIEAMRGTWLRFLDDAKPLPLPRLRQLGSHTFLFAPSPVDGCDRWRALVRGSDALLTAVRTQTHAAEEQLAAAFPAFVRLLGTPAGQFALLRDAAGVALSDLVARTLHQGAALDETLVEAIARAVDVARDHAAAAQWRASPFEDDVVITWEGGVRWLGMRETQQGAMVSRGQRDPFASVAFAEGAEGADGAAEDAEIARALAGTLAALFPEERAAEMSLREEVTLWTRDGLADLERATRGRPSP